MVQNLRAAAARGQLESPPRDQSVRSQLLTRVFVRLWMITRKSYWAEILLAAGCLAGVI